jgi:hypothetical protein
MIEYCPAHEEWVRSRMGPGMTDGCLRRRTIWRSPMAGVAA